MNKAQAQKKVDRWTIGNNIAFTVVFTLYFVVNIEISWLIGLGLLSFSIFWIINRTMLAGIKPFAGYANWITLFRLLLVSIVIVDRHQLTDIVIFIIVFTAVLMDGLDGWIARKTNQVSNFGAHFDMETDAFYVVTISLVLHERGMFGNWIIIVGFMRYLFGTFLYVLQWHHLSPLRLRWGPVIAGIFYVALTTPFILSHAIYRPVVMISGFLIIISFTASLLWIIHQLIQENKQYKK